MTKSGTLEVRDRGQWRMWLAKNHSSSPGVWLARREEARMKRLREAIRLLESGKKLGLK